MFDLKELTNIPDLMGQVPSGYLNALTAATGMFHGQMPDNPSQIFDSLKQMAPQQLFKNLIGGMTGMPWDHITGLARNPHQPLWDMFPNHYANPWQNNQAQSGQVRG